MSSKVEEAKKLLEALVATQSGVECKGKTTPYTSMNGHMFSFINKEGGYALRLPKDEREAFLKKYKTELAVSHGTVMKEYVAVPPALFKKTRELAKHFAVSIDYIGSLKPKPTTRKKVGKKKATAKKVAKKASKKKATKKATRKK